jgi:HD-GYP domain-containing protein (c-di-GMP phosphodiesterase class II)
VKVSVVACILPLLSFGILLQRPEPLAPERVEKRLQLGEALRLHFYGVGVSADLVASEEAYLGARVRALMVRLEAKDASTEEHTRRVAMLAVPVGERLGLSPSRLRSLASGGLLHDIGKLSVPDSILQKPTKRWSCSTTSRT